MTAELTDLYSIYLNYLVAHCLNRCGITKHSAEIANHIERTVIERHFTDPDKQKEYENNNWSIAETFTLVDQHKIDPLIKGVLSISEIQNLLDCSDNGEILITIHRECKPPFAQTWNLQLKPNINLFSTDPFSIQLKIQIALESPESEMRITKIDHDAFDVNLFLQKMETYKLFHSKIQAN